MITIYLIYTICSRSIMTTPKYFWHEDSLAAFCLIHATLGRPDRRPTGTKCMSSYLHGSGHFMFGYKLHQGCQSSLLCQHSYLYTQYVTSRLTAIVSPWLPAWLSCAHCHLLLPRARVSPRARPEPCRALTRVIRAPGARHNLLQTVFLRALKAQWKLLQKKLINFVLLCDLRTLRYLSLHRTHSHIFCSFFANIMMFDVRC